MNSRIEKVLAWLRAAARGSPRFLLIGAVYVALAWISLAFVGYGLGLKEYEKKKNELASGSATGKIEARWSWSMGFSSRTCFKVVTRKEWFCIHPTSVSRNVFFDLSPGTEVLIADGHRYWVYKLIVLKNGLRKTLVDHDVGLAYSFLAEPENPGRFIAAGVLLIPLAVAFQLLVLPLGRRLRGRASSA